jgi:hypothetical protein
VKRIGWDRRLDVACDGKGLVGHAGVVLLRRLADRVNLTGELAKALPVSAARGWLDRSTVLVQLAIAIALGAQNLSDAERLASHHQPLGLSGGSDSTMRRLLAGIDAKSHRSLARARSRVRSRVWALLQAAERGFPWVRVAGKTLTGWTVIDMDATIITCATRKEGAAGTFKGTWGHHPLAAWCANTLECLAMTLRPGNAGANDAADHITVFTAALAQIPAAWRRKVLVRIDGAGASHALLDHFQSLCTTRRQVAYTVGWKMTPADETAIGALPEAAWTEAVTTSGEVQHGYQVAELTGLSTRSGWPTRMRLIARRVRPSRRQIKNMTAFEQATGWVYSIQATNIAHTGLARLAGTGTVQFLDVLHRGHAVVEDRVRQAKACGLRLLPSQSWAVNEGWMLAANLAADLDTWLRLLGLRDQPDLADAEIGAMRHRLYAIPARLARHARRRTLRLAAHWPWAASFALCWNRIGTIAPLTALSRTPPHRPAAQRRKRGRYQGSDTTWRHRHDTAARHLPTRSRTNRENPDRHSNHTGHRRIEAKNWFQACGRSDSLSGMSSVRTSGPV